MSGLVQEVKSLSVGLPVPTLAALKRIVPPHEIKASIERAGKSGRYCKRVSAPMAVWFIVALGLFCGDAYRQVFRWLIPVDPGTRKRGCDAIPGRSTLCEVRHRLGLKTNADV